MGTVVRDINTNEVGQLCAESRECENQHNVEFNTNYPIKPL